MLFSFGVDYADVGLLYNSSRVKGARPGPTHLALQTSPGVLGVYVDPVPNLIHGELQQWADIAKVEHIRLPGYWMHKRGSSLVVGEKPSKGEKVVYFLHGGAYVSLSAHPDSPTSSIPKMILKECDRVKRSFAIEYRLSAGAPLKPAFPFPTALVDALAGYNYLVNSVGFAPEDIIVVGDSAGGNLALALTRYLVEYASQLAGDLKSAQPRPGAMLLLSPWSDLSNATHNNPNASINTRGSTDYLIGPSKRLNRSTNANYAARAFVGPHGYEVASLQNPYISPGSPGLPEGKDNFKGFPRTLIVGGDAELLIDQIRLVKERMMRDLGKDEGKDGENGLVRYHEAKDAVHDFLVFPWFESGRKETIGQIKKWIAEL
jgi:acetyl esterase/lipase